MVTARRPTARHTHDSQLECHRDIDEAQLANGAGCGSVSNVILECPAGGVTYRPETECELQELEARDWYRTSAGGDDAIEPDRMSALVGAAAGLAAAYYLDIV